VAIEAVIARRGASPTFLEFDLDDDPNDNRDDDGEKGKAFKVE